MHRKNHDPKGNLAVPQTIQPMYLEPGLLATVSTITNFYVRPPRDKKEAYTIEMDQEAADENHVVMRRKDNTTENLIVLSKLNVGDEVLERDFEYQDPKDPTKLIKHPFIKQVATFERLNKEKSELRESGNEIKVKEIGYIYSDDLAPVEKYIGEKENIFPNVPSKEDIVQAGLGDCFLLSSLIGILNTPNGQQFIMDMMKEQDDGTVIVRLFNPNNNEPVYVKVEKSYQARLGNKLSQHRAPWVHILEKAYAGLGYKAKALQDKHQSFVNAEYVIANSSLMDAYGNGGDVATAQRVLLGTGTQMEWLHKNKSNTNPFYSTKMKDILTMQLHRSIKSRLFEDNNGALAAQIQDMASEKEIGKMYKEIEKIALDAWMRNDWIIGEVAKLKIYSAFNGDRSLLLEWSIYLYVLSFYFPETLEKLNNLNSEIKDFDYDGMLKFMDGLSALDPKPSDVIIKNLCDYINKEITRENKKVYRFSGRPPLSGQYTQTENQLFDSLKQDIANNKIITAGTKTDFAGVPGLRAGHAYTMTRTLEETNDGKTVKYVILRNPWGMTGRSYSKDMPIEVEDEEFKLDICDFYKYFQGYTVGEMPKLGQIEEKVKALKGEIEKKRDKIYEIPLAKRSVKETVIDDLLNIQSKERKAYFSSLADRDVFEIEHLLWSEIVNKERLLLNSGDKYLSEEIDRKSRLLMRDLESFIKKNYDKEKRSELTAKYYTRYFEKDDAFRKPFVAGDDKYKVDLIYKLVTTKYHQKYLAIQSYTNLTALLNYIKADLLEKKRAMQAEKNNHVKEIYHHYLNGERALLAGVERELAHRVANSSSYTQITANAKDYIAIKKKQNGLFYKVKHSFKSLFFSKNENEILKNFKRHEKYVKSISKTFAVQADAEPIALAKEYLLGKPKGLTGNTSYDRVADLYYEQSKFHNRIYADMICDIEITAIDGDKDENGRSLSFGLNIKTKDKIKTAGAHHIELTRDQLIKFARAQHQYRQEVLAAIDNEFKKSNKPKNEFYSDYLNEILNSGNEVALRHLPISFSRQFGVIVGVEKFSVTSSDTGYTINAEMLNSDIDKAGNFSQYELDTALITAYECKRFAAEENDEKKKILEATKKTYEVCTLQDILVHRYKLHELGLEYLLRCEEVSLPHDLRNFLMEHDANKYSWQIDYKPGDQEYELTALVESKKGEKKYKTHIISGEAMKEFAINQYLWRQGLYSAGKLNEITRLGLNISELAAEQLMNDKASAMRYISSEKVISHVLANPKNPNEFTVTYSPSGKVNITLKQVHIEWLAIQRFEQKLQEDYYHKAMRRFRA